MPYKDLRHFLRVLEEKQKLFRIAKEVDKDWELATIAKLVFRKVPDERRPALLFENVKGFSIPVVTGVLGASRENYALALETKLDFDEIFRRWSRAQATVAPVVGLGDVAYTSWRSGNTGSLLAFRTTDGTDVWQVAIDFGGTGSGEPPWPAVLAADGAAVFSATIRRSHTFAACFIRDISSEYGFSCSLRRLTCSSSLLRRSTHLQVA